MMADLPVSGPNSGTNTHHTFSLIGAEMYAFKILAALTSMELRAAMVSVMQMVSHETMLAYVMVMGAPVMCPPATIWALLWKSSILMSNIMWNLITYSQ
jgi:hypothetical protein